MSNFDKMTPEEREAWFTEVVVNARNDVAVADDKSRKAMEELLVELRFTLLNY